MSQSDFVSRGQALVAAGQFQEAVKVCRLGLLGRPTTVEGRVVLGQALLALKRFDEVLAEMRVALELDHQSVAAQALKAEALLHKGDHVAAVESLQAALNATPGEPRLQQLLREAGQLTGRGPKSASHPSAGFVGSGDTKHYPNNQVTDEFADGDGFTRPTQVAAPGSLRRSSQRSAVSPDPVPPPAVLEVGDHSGTMEVDPEREGVELPDDEGDALAAPPAAKRPGKVGGARGQVKSTGRGAKRANRELGAKTPTMDLELDDDNVEEIDPVIPAPAPAIAARGPSRSAVRDAVRLPSGPLDIGRSKGPTSPPPLVQSIASQPGAVQMQQPRGPIAAALPTVAALEPPRPPPPLISAASAAAAQRPTMAVTVPEPPPDPRSLAAAAEPTMRPEALDPALLALAAVDSAEPAQPAAQPAAGFEHAYDRTPSRGARRSRSPMQILLWCVVGIIVIGGGVVAGFQIRALRLGKQIAAAKVRAAEQAKTDTWIGWSAARDSLAGIVQASATLENRAALARARGLLADEFGDATGEAATAVDRLAGQGGFDGDIAAAYTALAQGDAKSAKLAADAAIAMLPQDPAALYVTARATLLAGDARAAEKQLQHVVELEPRPLYLLGLAHAAAAAYAYDEALAAIDRALGTSPDHPAGLIARATVLVAAGRIGPNSSLALEVRGQLEKMITEGRHPLAEQPHGVSPAELALGNLALARVDFARGDSVGARGDFQAATAVAFDDLRFHEDAVDTLVMLGDVEHARKVAEAALGTWPASRRLRLALAELALAAGKPSDALAELAKQPELVQWPVAMALRGEAHLESGDVDGARGDFEAALKKQPDLEPALVGRAWLALDAGDVTEARTQIETHYKDGASPELATIYAATLRASGDPAQRDKAKAILDKVVAGAPSAATGRARLELARLDRDLGDFRAARADYAEASRTGSFDARLESGLLQIEDRDLAGGRDTLDQLYKEAADHATPTLVLELARARMLVGDHAGAQQLLESAAKMPGVSAWKLAREQGRLALRRGEFAAAAKALSNALDASGDDSETFLLAADAATADIKNGLGDKITKLVTDRIGKRPEAGIVAGKLLVAAGKDADAAAAFRTAREQLKTEKASARRLAQADYGLAVTAYDRQNDPDATSELELVMNEDPSIYDAYLFAAEVAKDPKKKYELARKATQYNPDYPRAWAVVGKLAFKLGEKPALADALARLAVLAPHGDEVKELQALHK